VRIEFQTFAANYFEPNVMSPRIKSTMLVGEVATRTPVCVDQDSTIVVASNLMRIYQVADLVVTHQREGKLMPAGVLSARDIVTRVIAKELDPTALTAGDIVWSGPAGARVTDNVSQTVRFLQATRRDLVPVIDGEGGLAGVVSLDDLLWALAAK
jgi:CBS domain-containing protein